MDVISIILPTIWEHAKKKKKKKKKKLQKH